MKVVFNFPDELDEMKILIDRYENADSKAADTSKTEPIITQDEEEIQEQITLEDIYPMEDDLDVALESIGLKFSKSSGGGSPSSNVIGCRCHIEKYANNYGIPALMKALQTIRAAWPKGGKKWHWGVIQDVWAFYSHYRHEDIDMDMLARHLSKKVASQEQITPADFLDMITQIPGEATLKRYNSGCSYSRIG